MKEIPSEEKKPKEEPELKITKEIEIEELPKEDVIYKLVKYGSKKYPQTKVIKKSKTYKYGRELDNEEPIHNDAVIYEPNKEEPNIKIIRKKIVPKDGKDEEVEEEPGKLVIYKVIKCGPIKTPQTKMIRKRTINDNGKDKEIEEDIPGDEIIVKKIKYGKEPNAKILRKIIIVKDGKEQEIEEEVPLEEEPKKEIEEVKPEEEPEQKIIKKKIVTKDGEVKEPVEEITSEEKKPKEEPEQQIKPKEIEIEELPNEDIIYKIIKAGTKRFPQTKVIKKTKINKFGREQEKEEQVPHDEIIYEPIEEEKPTTKIIRKKIVPKDGKDEEVEEEPGKLVIYKVIKYGPTRTPQTKIIRKRTIDDNGKDKEIEEDIPGDEVIVK